MGYDKKKLYQQAIKAITEKDLVFVEEVVACLPISKETFYKYYKVGSDELDELKGLLEKNKISTKQELRKKWRDSDNATLQLALYKLLSNDNEMLKLAMQNIDVKSDGEKISFKLNGQ